MLTIRIFFSLTLLNALMFFSRAGVAAEEKGFRFIVFLVTLFRSPPITLQIRFCTKSQTDGEHACALELMKIVRSLCCRGGIDIERETHVQDIPDGVTMRNIFTD